MELFCLLRAHQPDLDQIKRADEAVADAEAAGIRDRVSKPDRPVMLEQDQCRGRVVGDVLQDVPRLIVARRR